MLQVKTLTPQALTSPFLQGLAAAPVLDTNEIIESLKFITPIHYYIPSPLPPIYQTITTTGAIT